MKFFTSDHHFHHSKIIQYCKRPFASVEEMDEALVANWNSVVSVDDEVYHLGDILFAKGTPEELEVLLGRLNGKLYLITGNHDYRILKKRPYAYLLRGRCEWIKNESFVNIKVAGKKQEIFLKHFSMRVWDRKHYGVWHLFGHSHGDFDEVDTGLSFDVGVDSHNFTPLSTNQVIDLMAVREWQYSYGDATYYGNQTQ